MPEAADLEELALMADADEVASDGSEDGVVEVRGAFVCACVACLALAHCRLRRCADAVLLLASPSLFLSSSLCPHSIPFAHSDFVRCCKSEGCRQLFRGRS